MAGRPVEYTEEVINGICEKMETYIAETDNPKLAEFCYNNNLDREALYAKEKKFPQLNDTIKKLFLKKEFYLEEILTSKPHVTGSIFILKQSRLNWRDKVETENINLNTDTAENFKKAKQEITEIFE